MALLLFFLLFGCGEIGLIIGVALIVLFLCAITESWWILLVILAIGVGCYLDNKRKASAYAIGNEDNAPKTLEMNDENIILLVRLVRRMPDDGRHSISQSNVADLATVEQFDLCKDWFSKNADEYVIIGYNTIRARGKEEKIKLTNLLLDMKRK